MCIIKDAWKISGVIVPLLSMSIGACITYYFNFKVQTEFLLHEEKKTIVSQYSALRLDTEIACRQLIASTGKLVTEFPRKGENGSLDENLKHDFIQAYLNFLSKYDFLSIFIEAYTNETLDTEIRNTVNDINDQINNAIETGIISDLKVNQLLYDKLRPQLHAFPVQANKFIMKRIKETSF